MIICNDRIVLKRFYLRHLSPIDATDEYLSWFNDSATLRFIDYAKSERSRDDLVAYINSKNLCDSTLFFGIFAIKDNSHIGNIKFEPIDFMRKSAEMGILIGNKQWRSRGVGTEVISGAGLWLRNELNLKTMTLGVSHSNDAAVAAYKKIGFDFAKNHEFVYQNDCHRMSLRLEILK